MNDRHYQSIYEHSRKLGFLEQGANEVATRLISLAGEYKEKELARGVFAKSYPTHTRNLFTNQQLERFVREVRKNSFRPDEWDMEKAMGWSEWMFNFMRRQGELSEREIQEYLQDKAEYIKETKDAQELKGLKSLTMNGHSEYDILNMKMYKNIEPSPSYKEPQIRIVPMPMGGMPGYKMRMRRP